MSFGPIQPDDRRVVFQRVDENWVVRGEHDLPARSRCQGIKVIFRCAYRARVERSLRLLDQQHVPRQESIGLRILTTFRRRPQDAEFFLGLSDIRLTFEPSVLLL